MPAHALPGGVAQHTAIAALVGFGVSTVSTMFIVGLEPQPRRDQRIGALQACNADAQPVGC